MPAKERGRIVTILSVNAKITRETRATYRGRAVVVELTGHEITLRLKGRRHRVGVPILAVLDLGYKMLAREAAAEKKEAKRAGRKR
jgi:hypothetical protein